MLWLPHTKLHSPTLCWSGGRKWWVLKSLRCFLEFGAINILTALHIYKATLPIMYFQRDDVYFPEDDFPHHTVTIYSRNLQVKGQHPLPADPSENFGMNLNACISWMVHSHIWAHTQLQITTILEHNGLANFPNDLFPCIVFHFQVSVTYSCYTVKSQ